MSNKYISAITEYGECIVRECHLKNGVTPTILTAVNKNDYFSNMANKIHNGLYEYKDVRYLDAKTKVEITCKIHGNFNQTPNGHLNGKGCPKCGLLLSGKSKRNTQDDFINKSNEKHNFKYDYSNSEYKLQHNFVSIICPIHGEFSMKAKDHLRGQGCTFCGRESISKHRSEEPTGWSLTDWILASERSPRFDSFKVYVIRCFNDNEEFVKIGRTYNKVSWRFRNKVLLPYEFEILHEIIGSAKFILDKETELKSKLKQFKYIPKIKFNGMQECFNLECINKLKII